MLAEPMPSMRMALTDEVWTLRLVKMRMAGAAARPVSSMSIRKRARTLWRAAASAVKWAIWQPLVKAKLALEGNVEDVFEPGSGDLFDDSGGGGVRVDGGVLVPCRGEEIGSECGGKGTTDDPAEETAAGGAMEAVLAGFDKVFDNCGGIESGVVQLDAEGGAELIEGRGSSDAGLRLGDVFESVIEG